MAFPIRLATLGLVLSLLLACSGGSDGRAGGSGASAVGTGGTTSSAGGPSSGGVSSGSGGTDSDDGAGPVDGCPKTCGSHKWACWTMPNPEGTDLPHPATYTADDGIVRDELTCLEWQQTAPDSTYSNADAIAYCESLTLGGHADWRLPTRVELASIVDFTRGPALDPAFTPRNGFHKTGSNWVLTIDQRGAGTDRDLAWAYNMSDGIVSNAKSAADTDSVRCVRGNGSGEGFVEHAAAPPNQYTLISGDEVRDNYTGLVWQRDGDASDLLSWEDAVTYCEDLALGGHTDWRLPSIRELATLVDEAQVAPSINRTMFPNTHYGSRSNNWYWASHRARNQATAAWAINFDDGFTGFNSGAEGAWNHFTEAYAKCVR